MPWPAAGMASFPERSQHLLEERVDPVSADPAHDDNDIMLGVHPDDIGAGAEGKEAISAHATGRVST